MGAGRAAVGAVATTGQPGQPSLAVDVIGVTRRHPARRGSPAVLANDDVTLQVEQGSVFGLLGPNGAGKTTLVRQLVGVLAPDEGRVWLLGHDITERPDRAARLVAYLAQDEPALRELTVGLALETTARLRGLRRPAARAARNAVAEELGLGDLLDRPLVRLSGGQRRLAEFGTVLVGERPLLVLDEPTAGLDAAARRAVWDALSRRRTTTTVVLVTHNVLEAETVLDRVAVLDRGRVIACDTPGRLKALVSDEVRLDLVWQGEPPAGDPTVERLRAGAAINGRRWSIRLPAEQARTDLGLLTSGPTLAALDDFRLATASLEDVYLLLGGQARDLERS